METDHRLYVIETGWRVQIKPDDGRSLYSFWKEEGADSHPRITAGEIYLTNDIEVFDINSAIRKGIVTTSRPTLDRPGRR